MTQKNNPGDDAPAEKDSAPDPVMAELKKMYDGVVEEPLPQDLLNLLDKLDEAERSR